MAVPGTSDAGNGNNRSGQPQATNMSTDTGQTDTTALNQMYSGAGFLSMIEDLFNNPGAEGDDSWKNMRDAFQFSIGSAFANSYLTNYQSELNAAQNKGLMGYANMLDRQTMQESRNQIFGLNMLTMDKQFNLNDQFANNDLTRNLTYMDGLGQQTRLNYSAEGQQQRLGMITAGEQQRLGIAAMGEQSRLGTIVAGEQQRLGIAATGVETRANIRTQGNEDRLGYRVQGQEQRQNIAATGVENRAQARVEGDETRKNIGVQGTENRALAVTEGKQTRKNIAATGFENRAQARVEGDEQRKGIAAMGVENRLQAVAEGEQTRLNIGKTATEQRSTMSHADNVSAGREKRQNAAARAGARSF